MKKIRLPHTKHSILAIGATVLLCTGTIAAGVALSVLGPTRLVPHQSVAAALYPSQIAGELPLTAKAAILFDPTNGRVIYEKNPVTQLPLASITKLMTAEILLTQESPETPVTMTAQALRTEGESGFMAGDVVSLAELLKFGLIASSNDAMQAAAESLGDNYLQRMNQAAQNLGLKQTYFLNPTGLDVNFSTSGAYSSAYDVARLAALFSKQYPATFALTQQNSVSIAVGTRILTGHATAEPILSIPGIVGAKTGYTDLAGGNLVVIFDIEIGHPLVAVVLGSTREGRFEDIQTLISAARHN